MFRLFVLARAERPYQQSAVFGRASTPPVKIIHPSQDPLHVRRERRIAAKPAFPVMIFYYTSNNLGFWPFRISEPHQFEQYFAVRFGPDWV